MADPSTAPAPPGTVTGPHQVEAPKTGHHQSYWLWIMCLTGVDYFSTLGYQPSIAFKATGLLTPFATMILIVVTLFGALPVYSYVAKQSPHGQGSIAMLERLLHGWWGKTLVLVLLGFAATDFVITKTLSAADAAEHVVKNPLWLGFVGWFPETWHEALAGHPALLVLTMFFLVALGAMFMRGFKEVIGMAIVIVAGYLLLNAIVIGSSVYYLSQHPHELERWYANVQAGDWHFHSPVQVGTDFWSILLVCLLLFPKLALGLSGFETGVAVMPLVKGRPDDDPQRPLGRVRNTRKLLATAAVIMSVLLLGSSMAVSTLIKPEALEPGHDGKPGGPAANRALAYLAHGEELVNGEYATHINPMFGEVFGTVYDLATVIILWFAGPVRWPAS